MRLYQRIALAGVAILATLTGLSISRADPVRDYYAKLGLERKLTQNPTEANKRLRVFPDSFKKASVKKYEVPEAKYCLAHVKQLHYRSPLIVGDIPFLSKSDNQILQERNKTQHKITYNYVNNFQKDIYDVLKELSKKGFNRVRLEGATKPAERANCTREFRTIQIELLAFLGDVDLIKRYYFVPGAGVMLGSQGDIKVLPAEKPMIFERARRNPKNKKYVFDARENALLELVDEQGDAFSIVLYGAKHDFKDNIYVWNQQNPNKKFSLIEVTAKSKIPMEFMLSSHK